MALSLSETLLGCHTIPLDRFVRVLWNALAFLVANAEAGLGPFVTLLGGFAIPLCGLGIPRRLLPASPRDKPIV
jgi:hypothetical protein